MGLKLNSWKFKPLSSVSVWFRWNVRERRST